MRNNFWKWLKRFFVVLPIFMLIIEIIFTMGGFWRENSTIYFSIGEEDVLSNYIIDGYDNNLRNPLIFDYDNFMQNQSILYNIRASFVNIYSLFSDDLDMVNLVYSNPYVYLTINFLTWWVFVELVFLFFRFVTFLISWVNSLFDNTFKKVKK